MPDPDYQPEIIEKPPAPDRFAETPRLHNIIADWWREATGQTAEWHHDLSPGRAILRKIMLWSPAFVVVVLVGGGLGVYFFTSWRADDLAAKALASLKRGDQREIVRAVQRLLDFERSGQQIMGLLVLPLKLEEVGEVAQRRHR